MRVSLYEYCLSCGREDLLSQWDKERNAPLTPKDISYGSKQKVWWRCEKGHSWQPATVRVALIVQVVGFGRVKMIWRLKGQT